MNVSKPEQRTLHALARGGAIHVEKDEKGKLLDVICVTREGWALSDCTPDIFRRLRSKRLVASVEGGPYRISRQGLAAVRSQPDNR